MRIVYQLTITDDDVRQNVKAVVNELESDSVIAFPDEESKLDFITDCADIIIDKFDDGFYDDGNPNYEVAVLDNARDYDYLQ